MRPLVLLIYLLSTSSYILSQKENNIWYFGNRAGIDFNSSPPAALEGNLVAIEGCAAISDPAGRLLFYTNGVTIWDRNHNTMPNGTALLGGESSTQAVLIVPLPKSNNLYYVFTTEDYLTNGGIHYSIVNMNLNGGFGDVESSAKNILVVDQVGEKVTSVLHSNGLDIWILTHKKESNEFLSYLLTSTGLDIVPVISPVGSIYSAHDPIGPIRSSHTGNRIISTSTYNNILEIFDFNRNTGVLSNSIDLYHLFNEQQYIYGIEFSPNDSLVYLTSSVLVNTVFQLQLSTNHLTVLVSSTGDSYGAAQLAPDNRIYIANYANQYLDVIHEPNKLGLNCLYESTAFKLAEGTSSFGGFPNPAAYSFFRNESDFNIGHDTALCIGGSLVLSTNVPIHCDSINYNWSDGSIGSELVVTNSGIYWLEVKSPCINFIDTIQVSLIHCQPIIHYDLNACRSVMVEGSHLDYSEFTPAYPFTPICASVLAENIFREPNPANKHSCTPGINNSPAMCVTILETCEYDPGNGSSVIIEFSITPAPDSTFQLTGFEFFEKGPLMYDWINGVSGLNNHPLLYGIRILRDNIEIFRRDSVHTSISWRLQNYDFINDISFTINEKAVFRIEILPYCPIGNTSDVSAWDVDELIIYGGCITKLSKLIVHGKLETTRYQSISGAQMQLSQNYSFSTKIIETTDLKGGYYFMNLDKTPTYYLRSIKDDDFLNGVSTLDLIFLQRYLLGLEKFMTFEQFIAADINKSANINVMDLVDLRKVLLGVYSKFPNNTSWRISTVPLGEIFNDFSQFKEKYEIENIQADTLRADFIGIKIGDINGDVNLQYDPHKRDRITRNSIELIMDEISIKPNAVFHAKFKVENEVDVYGFQFAIELHDVQFISVKSNLISLTEDNYTFIDGILRVSCNSDHVIKIRPGSILFSVELNSTHGGLLSSKIKEFHKALLPEIYLENLDIADLKLIASGTYQNQEVQDYLYIKNNLISQQVNFEFELSEDSYVVIGFYDLLGRCLYLSRTKHFPGIHAKNVNYDEIPGYGIMYCQLMVGDQSLTRKVVKLN